MAEEIRIWTVQNGTSLRELSKSKLNLEERLETWMAEDISILSDDLLVMGRQVETAFGGFIDLLCLDQNGDLVIVELKRDKTPREVTAQVLDYASWVKDISNDEIVNIANRYLGSKGPFEKAFSDKFKIEMPQSLNENHRMLIVASEIDASSERIIKYLSDDHGININAVTFQYFKSEGSGEFLARVFLIEPSQVEYKTRTKSSSKRRRNLTYEELLKIADENGVGHMYRQFISELEKYFYKDTSASSIRFTTNLDGSRKVVFSLIPPKSSSENGLHFQIYFQRIQRYFNVDETEILALLPEMREEWKYYEAADADFSGFAGFFSNISEVNSFIAGLARFK